MSSANMLRKNEVKNYMLSRDLLVFEFCTNFSFATDCKKGFLPLRIRNIFKAMD